MNLRESIDLIETISFCFLTEDARFDFLLNTYKNKLIQKGDDPQQIITTLTNADPGSGPTKKKIYTQWLVNNYLKDDISLNDLPKITRYLEIFDEIKSKLSNKDIGNYKSVEQLYDTISDISKQVLVNSDPSNDGKYTEWLTNLYLKGLLKTEDLPKIENYLQIFDKNSLGDISKYTSIEQLFKAIEPFYEKGLISAEYKRATAIH